MKYRPLAAEFLGTFLLAFLVRTSFDVQAIPTPVVAGLTLGMIVYMFGGISGAHVNPAVTLGLAAVRKIKPIDATFYIIAQLLGGGLAFVAGNALELSVVASTATEPLVYFGETLGAAILVLGVASVVFGKTPADASGLTIGTSLALGAIAASAYANGVVNPAVAIGVGSVSVAYIVAPLIGGIIAAWGYRALVR